VALALVLLIGAGLMVKTFQRMWKLHPGFNPENLLTMEVVLPALKYRNDAEITGFYDRVLRRLRALPEVKGTGASAYLGTAEGIHIEGRPEPRPGEPRPEIRAASSHYFETMEIPLLNGRLVSEQDGPETLRVVVLSDTVSRHYWPGSNPIGQRVRLGNSQSPWLTVIGVCGDVKEWFSGVPLPAAYVPYLQAPQLSMRLVLRTVGDPLQTANSARTQIRQEDRGQPVYDVKSMEQIISEQTSGVRIAATTMSTYATIALLLAITGVYAVISYSVAQRTHEIGVRIALGAAHGDVLKMVVGQALRMAMGGLAVGVPMAFILTRLMSSVLYNVVAADWITFGVFTALLGLSALLAGYIPARRVTKVDPLIALRHE
jgi:predicted permease